jgi:TIR domain
MTDAIPKVFISYSHDTVAHQERVLDLADRLRADGIDAEVDQYNAAPPEGWPRWCERQIEAANFVLMVCTESYQRRVRGEEEPGQGLGVVWEAGIIRQLLYDAGTLSDKFVPVLFSDGAVEDVPTLIKGRTRYVVDTEDGYKGLLRQLSGQPRLPRPALGTKRVLPSRDRRWSEGELPSPDSPIDGPQPSPRPSDLYPGLRAFTSDQADFFFGREHETDELIARLRTGCGFLTIVGASGIGRSSLVYAGLLPRLAEGAIEGSAKWPAISFKPGSQGNYPFLALANALKPLLPPGSVGEPIDLADALRRDPATIADFIDKTLTNAPTSAQLVLFVDQLEELFTQAKEDYREGFVDLLSKAAWHRRVRVLATLRADFRPQADKYAELDSLLQAGTFELKPAGHQALTRMIRGPAEHVGMKLEDELVDKILEDAGRNAGALPLVAFCLRELYEKCKSADRMTLKVYSEEIGGLFTAIGKHADNLLAEWEKNLLVEWEKRPSWQKIQKPNVDTALETIFWVLVTVDPDEKVFRRRATREEFGENAVARELSEVLTKGRLLICTNSSDDSGECVTVELAHEALLVDR